MPQAARQDKVLDVSSESPLRSKATVRFRAASGATIQRAFAEDTQAKCCDMLRSWRDCPLCSADLKVSALFEFAAVADWDGPALGRPFDLRISL